MYSNILYNKELDKWLSINNLNNYKKLFYDNKINTLYKLSLLLYEDLKIIIPDKDFKTYKNIISKIHLIKPHKKKSLKNRIINFKDKKASLYSILYNKYAIDNALSKTYIQTVLFIYSMISLGELLVSFTLFDIYFYSYSFEFTSTDINHCFNNNEFLKNVITYNKMPKIVLLANYILTFIISYNGYTIEASKIFKFTFILYLFSVAMVNTNIITICTIFELENADVCNKFCNPYGFYKIPFFELLIIINIYLFYYYQPIGYRFLFILSLSKSISSIIINFEHIKKETISIHIINNDIYKLYGNIIFNLLIIAVTEFLYLYANIKSYLIIRNDWNYYNNVYNALKMNESQELQEFNTIIKSINYDNDIVKQKINNLDELYDIGFLLNVKFQKILYVIAKKSTGILVPSSVKNPKRSIEKICRHYNRDTTQLCDIMRASILFCNNNKCDNECYKCKTLLMNEFDNELDDNDIVLNIRKSISVCENFIDTGNNSISNFDNILDISNRSKDSVLYNVPSNIAPLPTQSPLPPSKTLKPFPTLTTSPLPSLISEDLSYPTSLESLKKEKKRNLSPLESLKPFKYSISSTSSKRFSIFEDTNVSESFSKHIKNIKEGINRVSSDSNSTLGDNGFCSNLLLFIKELNNNKYIKIVKIKNRFDNNYNPKTTFGYRDVLINVKIQYELELDKVRFLNYTEWNDKNNYVIAEIQLHSIDMYNYKVIIGHKNYKKHRDIMSI